MARLNEMASRHVASGTGSAELFLPNVTLDDGEACYSAGNWLRWLKLNVRTFRASDTVAAYLKTGCLPV